MGIDGLIRSLPEGKVVSPRWLSNKGKFFNFNNMDIVVLPLKISFLFPFEEDFGIIYPAFCAQIVVE